MDRCSGHARSIARPFDAASGIVRDATPRRARRRSSRGAPAEPTRRPQVFHRFQTPSPSPPRARRAEPSRLPGFDLCVHLRTARAERSRCRTRGSIPARPLRRPQQPTRHHLQRDARRRTSGPASSRSRGPSASPRPRTTAKRTSTRSAKRRGRRKETHSPPRVEQPTDRGAGLVDLPSEVEDDAAATPKNFSTRSMACPLARSPTSLRGHRGPESKSTCDVSLVLRSDASHVRACGRHRPRAAGANARKEGADDARRVARRRHHAQEGGHRRRPARVRPVPARRRAADLGQAARADRLAPADHRAVGRLEGDAGPPLPARRALLRGVARLLLPGEPQGRRSHPRPGDQGRRPSRKGEEGEDRADGAARRQRQAGGDTSTRRSSRSTGTTRAPTRCSSSSPTT